MDNKQIAEKTSLQRNKPSLDEMRCTIIEIARQLEDEKLVRMLYIRAKTLKNHET